MTEPCQQLPQRAGCLPCCLCAMLCAGVQVCRVAAWLWVEHLACTAWHRVPLPVASLRLSAALPSTVAHHATPRHDCLSTGACQPGRHRPGSCVQMQVVCCVAVWCVHRCQALACGGLRRPCRTGSSGTTDSVSTGYIRLLSHQALHQASFLGGVVGSRAGS